MLKSEMKSIFLNSENDTQIKPEILTSNGFKSLSLINDQYVEVTLLGSDATKLRDLRIRKFGRAHFYLNETRYYVYDVTRAIAEKSGRPAVILPEPKPAPAPKKQPAPKVEEPKVEEPKPVPTKPVKKVIKTSTDVPKNPMHDRILGYLRAKRNVLLVGAAGTGKNHTLELIAQELGLTFYMSNCITQEFKLTGFVTPKLSGEDTFVETEFYRAWTRGGLFFIDELDGSAPDVLININMALANGYFVFPHVGRVDAHPDFRCVAAANTVGNGASELYTGRAVIDISSLDRFCIVKFDYALEVERHIAKGNEELVQFVRALRKCAVDQGIRTVFSYRCIIDATALEMAEIPLEWIMTDAILKGLDQDTIKTLKVARSSIYKDALEALKMTALVS